MTIDESKLQLEKAPWPIIIKMMMMMMMMMMMIPIDVRVVGRVMDVSPHGCSFLPSYAKANAESPIIVTLVGIITDVSDEHPLKVLNP